MFRWAQTRIRCSGLAVARMIRHGLHLRHRRIAPRHPTRAGAADIHGRRHPKQQLAVVLALSA